MSGKTRQVAMGLALVLFAVAAARGAEVNALAKWVPADSLAFVAYDGNNAACKDTALASILNEPEIKALLEGPMAALKKLIAAEAMKKGQLDADVLMPLLGTKVGLAFVGLTPPAGEGEQPQPEVLLIAEVGQPDSAAAKSVNLLVDYLLKQAGMPPDAFKADKVAGVDAKIADIHGVTVAYAVTQGHFVMGSGGALLKALDANTTKLSATKEFQYVSGQTGGNEVLLVHYAHASVLQKFGFFMPRRIGRVLLNADFGLANVKSLTLACAPDGRGFKVSLLIHAPGEQKGILKLAAGKPLSPDLVKLAPKNAETFCACSLDVAALWDFVVAQAAPTEAKKELYQRDMARARETLGFDLRDDLVASLGDEFAVFGPSLMVAAKLKDPAKFSTCLTTALGKLAEGAGVERQFRGAEISLKTMTYKDRTITYVDATRFPLPFQPCYMMAGDYAIFSAYPMALKEYINAMAGGESLADNSDFKAVRAKLGADLSSLYYADTGAFLTEVYGFLPIVMGLMKMVPEEFQALCPDPAKLPPPSTIQKHLFGCVAGGRAIQDGVLWESHSPVGVPTPPAIGQGGGVVMIPVMAGMLLPALARARDEARKAKDKSNLKQIGTAANMWLNTHGETKFYPPSLKSLVDADLIAEPRVFINPAGNTQLQEGKFVTDYECILDMVGRKVTEEEATAATPLAWDKAGFHRDGRNVVYFDSHVEFLPEFGFQQLMRDKILPWVEKHKAKAEEKPAPAPTKPAPAPKPVEPGLDNF